MIDIRVQAAKFDPGAQLARLGELRKCAVAAFVGSIEAGDEVEAVMIDHHAALAKAELARIAAEAEARWPLAGIILIHRHGRLAPVDRVLFAGVAASEVEAAGTACAWLVGQVRTRAPFWRKDLLADGAAQWRRPKGGE